MPLNEEQQAQKQQNKNLQQNVQQMQQREDMVRRDGGPAPDQILQNNVQQQRDIFEVEAPQANLFADFVVVDEVPEFELSEKDKQKARKKLVKDNAQDESDTFSLLEGLQSNPFKMLDWLKGSAEVDGASTSFKNLIKSFENLLSGTAQNVKTLTQDLLQAANSYLGSHRKKPAHLYGRQRVTMCKEIVKHIEVLPSMVMWQKHFCKDSNHDKMDSEATEAYTQKSKDVTNAEYQALIDTNSDVLLAALQKKDPSVTEVNAKALAETNITKFMRNCVEVMKINPEDGTYEANPQQKEKDAQWNKEWIDSYLPMLEAYEEMVNAKNAKDKTREENSRKLVEQYKAQREPMLQSMVETIMSISEEEIDRFITDPDYYINNIGKFRMYTGITMYVDSTQNPIEAEYFRTLPTAIQNRFDARCNILSLFLQSAVQETINQATKTKTGFIKTDSNRDLKDSIIKHRLLNEWKEKAFHSPAELEITDNDTEKYAAYKRKVNGFLSPMLKGDASKVKEDAENRYQSIMGYIDTYKDKTTGKMALPPVQAAQDTLISGSLEDRVALFILLTNLKNGALDNNYELLEAYESIYSQLSDCLSTIKTSSKAKTDKNGLNEQDAMRLGFIAASFGSIARNHVYCKLDEEISNLKFEENATKEEKESKIKEIYNKHMITTEGLLFETTAGLLNNMLMDSVGQFAVLLTRDYVLDNEKFNPNPYAFHRGMKIYDTYKTSNDVRAAIAEEFKSITNQLATHHTLERKNVPLLSKPLSELDVQKLLKKEVSREKSIPTTLNYKSLKQNKKANTAARDRATALLREAHINEEGAENLKINENYSSASEAVLDASMEKMTVIYHYFDQHFSHNFDRYDQYTLTAMRYEDVTKNEEELSPEELKIRKWNQALGDNYKKFRDHDEKGTSDLVAMIMERLDDMLRYNITPENVLDTNWLIAHYKELETLGSLSGCIDNMESAPTTYKEFLSQYNALPYKELFVAKSKVFSHLAMALYQLKPCLGIKNIFPDGKRLEASDYLIDHENYASRYDFNNDISMYHDHIEAVINSIKEYREVRDRYLKAHS